MTKVLTAALLTLGGAAILTSCGSGGGGGLSDNPHVKIESLQVKNANGDTDNPEIHLNEEFVITWKVKYGGSQGYHIEFYTAANNGGEDRRFEMQNCDIFMTDCDKGLRCRYFISEKYNDYSIECKTNDKNEHYTGNFVTRINPYTVNYITGKAIIFPISESGITTLSDKKSVPVRFVP